ncbi:unnamed protein product [Calypogeia fissa]
MMHWLLFGYVGLLPLLLFILVCGDRPAFEGTWMARVHNFVFGGGCFDSLLAVIGKVFGERGSNACAAAEAYCCGRPNPCLQVFYLAIVGGTYFSISSTSLHYIPGYYLGAWHRYAGQGAVLFGIILFLMTGFCDPGTINAATLGRHTSVFPFDNVIYYEKECSTCKIPRPARSKHCSICNRCVARFDHHCGWMNNCIGENNLRYFLGFLIWHVILCWYGVYLLGAILLGEIQDRNVMRTVTFYYGTSAKDVYPQIVQWLVIFYSAQVLMMIFLSVVSILLVSFTGYHIYLVVMNTTTNETYKWDDYQRWQAEMAWSKILAEESEKSDKGKAEVANKSVRKSGLLGFFSKSHTRLPSKPKPSSFKNDNVYNRGFFANAGEVVYPLSSRSKVPSRPSRRTKKKQ